MFFHVSSALYTLFAFHHVSNYASSSHEGRGDADKENSGKNRRNTEKAVAYLDYRLD